MTDIDMRSTTPFHTFDPADCEGIRSLMDALDAARAGDDAALRAHLDSHPRHVERFEDEGVDLAQGRAAVRWDDATLLFVATRSKGPDGGPAEPLHRGISMERLGRFPTADGNAITYLRQNLRDAAAEVLPLLDQLDEGCRSAGRGHDALSEGFGGLRLHGWLDPPEVERLRNALQKSPWQVSRDEPHDGGVRDVMRHLLIMLKSAEKRGCGVLMRAHA